MDECKQHIIHFSTVHSRHDVRIFAKQITTLANYFDNPVSFYVQDGLGNEVVDDGRILIVDIGKPPNSRLFRMTFGSCSMGLAVFKAQPIIAHFHDPELIPIGLILRIAGIKVIYDVHENVPHQVLSKHWIPVLIRRPVSWIISISEWLAGKVLTAIVAATPNIAQRFPQNKTVVVQNYPILSGYVAPDIIPYNQRLPHVAYVGGITRIRGIFEMIEAVNLVQRDDIRFHLAGIFWDERVQKHVESLSGWKRVQFYGWLDSGNVANLLGKVRIGLVLFHPEPNHVMSQPTKLFEYLSAGIPVVASNFPLWTEIVEGNQCGIVVDPLKPDKISEAIIYLLEHPDEAKQLGENGKKAVSDKYNWECEAENLLRLYMELLK